VIHRGSAVDRFERRGYGRLTARPDPEALIDEEFLVSLGNVANDLMAAAQEPGNPSNAQSSVRARRQRANQPPGQTV